jgi:hypothetical protein
MIAALSEPMMAHGTISLRYCIATPAFGFVRKKAMATHVGSAGTPEIFLQQRGTVFRADAATFETANSAGGLWCRGRPPLGSSRPLSPDGSEGGGSQSIGIELSLGRQLDNPARHKQSDGVLLVRQAKISKYRLVGTGNDGYFLRSKSGARLMSTPDRPAPLPIELSRCRNRPRSQCMSLRSSSSS